MDQTNKIEIINLLLDLTDKDIFKYTKQNKYKKDLSDKLVKLYIYDEED